MTEHPRDELAALALGALDPSELPPIEAHVRTCTTCTDEVQRYRDALHTYAAAVDVTAPDLRRRIVARARRTDPAAAPRSRWAGWLRRPVPAFVPMALSLLLIASLIGVAQSRIETDRYAAALANVPGARVVNLDATGAGSDMRGALVIPDGASPYIVMRMPAPEAGRVWEAWVLHGATPIPAGVVQSGGVITITLTAPFTSGDGVAVTQEPAGGSAAPTSAPVLAVPRT